MSLTGEYQVSRNETNCIVAGLSHTQKSRQCVDPLSSSCGTKKKNTNHKQFKQLVLYRQHVEEVLHRVATMEREQIKRTTKEKVATRHSKERGYPLEQESIKQTTIQGIEGMQHPTVDGQSQSEAKPCTHVLCTCSSTTKTKELCRPGVGIMEAHDRQVTTVFTVQPSIPPSALDKPNIMKRYHRRRTTR